MKKKSITLFLFILISLLICDRLVYITLHGIEENVYTGQSVGKANQFNSVKDSVDLLVLGSSRAARHVDPESFSIPGYNMGMDGTHLGYATALISTLKKEGQLVLVHVDHHEVYDIDYEGDDMLSLLNESKDSDAMEDFIKKYYPEEIYLSNLSNCYVYNGKVLGMLKNAFLGKNTGSRSNGFSPLVPTKNQKETFEAILEESGITQRIDIQEPVEVNHRFESFVDFAIEVAAKNHSSLIFFTSPSLNKVDEEIRNSTADFFNTKGVQYLDDLDFFKEFNIDYWKDRSHMSKMGAELYSIKLSKEIQQVK